MFKITSRDNIIKVEKVEKKEDTADDIWYVDKLNDLWAIPGTVLVRIYNNINPDNIITKFTDKAVAARRVFPLLGVASGDEKQEEPNPEKVPNRDPERMKRPGKKPGIIREMIEFCVKPEGGSMREIIAHLSETFPERNTDSMTKTCQINLGDKILKLRKHTIVRKREASRGGMVYRLTPIIEP